MYSNRKFKIGDVVMCLTPNNSDLDWVNTHLGVILNIKTDGTYRKHGKNVNRYMYRVFIVGSGEILLYSDKDSLILENSNFSRFILNCCLCGQFGKVHYKILYANRTGNDELEIGIMHQYGYKVDTLKNWIEKENMTLRGNQ